MKQETKIFISNLDRTTITNARTGEVVPYTIITYFVEKEENDKHVGPAQLMCYVDEKAFDKLKEMTFKWLPATLSQTVDKNRLKLKIKQVGNVLVS